MATLFTLFGNLIYSLIKVLRDYNANNNNNVTTVTMLVDFPCRDTFSVRILFHTKSEISLICTALKLPDVKFTCTNFCKNNTIFVEFKTFQRFQDLKLNISLNKLDICMSGNNVRYQKILRMPFKQIHIWVNVIFNDKSQTHNNKATLRTVSTAITK